MKNLTECKMMNIDHINQHIWTLEDLQRFLSHDDLRLRIWAEQRIVALHRSQSGPILASRLIEDDIVLLGLILNDIVSLPDAASYEPVLLEQLYKSEGERFAVFADALASIGCKEVLRWVYAALNRERDGVSFGKYGIYRLISALGKVGGKDARQYLWNSLNNAADDDTRIRLLVLAIARVAAHEDIVELIEFGRKDPSSAGETVLSVLDFLVDESHFYHELLDCVDYIEDELPAILDEHFGSAESGIVGSLRQASENEAEMDALLEAVMEDARQAIADACCDPLEWRKMCDLEETLTDYQKKMALSFEILDILAMQPCDDFDIRRREFCLALAMLKRIVDLTNEQRALASAQGDPEKLLAVLLGDTQGYMEDVVETVASFGAECLPRLIKEVVQSESGWSALRAVNTIRAIAERLPGECNSAIEPITRAMVAGAGTEIADACQSALVAIGPDALEYIAPYVRSDNDLDICLSGIFTAFPTKRSAEIIMDALGDEDYIAEWYASALKDIGHPDAVNFLIDRCDPNDPSAREAVLTLCAINGIDQSVAKEWIDSGEEFRERWMQAKTAALSEMRPARSIAGAPVSGGKKKSISKNEKKKRAKNRMMNKRKKK